MAVIEIGRLSKYVGVAVVSVAMVVSGCAQRQTQHSSGRPFTPAEQRLRQQADTFNQTVLEGCAAGAAAGTAGGALAGGDWKSALIGAVIGTAIGCGAGAYIANIQEQNTLDEQEMDKVITDVRADNQRLTGLVNSAQEVIAADKAKIDKIDRQLAAGQISMAQAQTEMASVDENQRYLESTLGNVRLRQNEWKQVAAEARRRGDTQKVAEMNREIAKLETQVASLESELDTLVERRRVSRVG